MDRALPQPRKSVLFLTMKRGLFNMHASRLSAIPLAAAFFAPPAALIASRFYGVASPQWFVRPMENTMWLIMSGVALLACLLGIPDTNRPSSPPGTSNAITATVFIAAAGLLYTYLPDVLGANAWLTPYIKELEPLVYLLFALAWGLSFGLPDRAQLQRAGAWLGFFVVCDCARVLAVQSPGRMLGDSDAIATLLLVSLCAGLRPAQNRNAPVEPDQGKSIWRFWIIFGIIASFSRTGLFAAAWVYAFFGRAGIWQRILVALGCALLFVVTLVAESMSGSTSAHYLDFWIMLECMGLVAQNPDMIYTGFSLGSPLQVVPPLSLMGIWSALFNTSPYDGIFIHQLQQFWLRIFMGWGVFAVVGWLAAVFGVLLRRGTHFGAGLAAACFAQGLSTDLFYSPATGIVLCMACLLALAPPPVTAARGIPHLEEDTPDTVTRLLSSTD